jgi:tripartite-type tricarboxylate transporter receptor subunit TctC
MNKRKLILATALAAIGLATLGGNAVAQANYPDRPIRLLMPFPPGGSTDLIARILGPVMSEKLGQPVVIENRAGAGGAIALDAVARAAPDGYTLGVGAIGGLGLGKMMGQTQNYDPFKDFAPVGMMVTSMFVVVASNNSKIMSFQDLTAQAKTNPNGLSIGHGGNGSLMHLSTELMKKMSNANLVPVPYKGTAPATQDAIAGQIPLAMSDIPTAIQQINAGTVKAIAVTSTVRSPVLPNVPTLNEAGLKGYSSVGWFAVVAPAKTPVEIINKVNAALNYALQNKAIHDRILATGSEPAPGTPEAVTQLLRADYDKWGAVIKTSNIKTE